MTHPSRTASERILRWAAIGAAVAGLVGGIAGLIIGLSVHPATAWFAIFELGLPATLLGGLVGALSGAIASAMTLARRRVNS